MINRNRHIILALKVFFQEGFPMIAAAEVEADPLVQRDVALLAAYAKDQDPSLLDDLIERYQSLVQATCWQIIGNRGLADDATQETFILLLRHAGEVHSSVPGWLHRTATMTSLRIRQREMTRGRREPLFCASDVPFQPGDDLMGEVHDLLMKLGREDRDLIIGHYLMGQSQQVLADTLGISQSAISRRIERAIERLREGQAKESSDRRMALIPLIFGLRFEQAPNLDVQELHRLRYPRSMTAQWIAFGLSLCVGVWLSWWLVSGSAAKVFSRASPDEASLPTPNVSPHLINDFSSSSSTLRWQHIAVQVENGQAFIVDEFELPPKVYLDPFQTWPLRKADDTMIRSILVSDLRGVSMSFDVGLFYDTFGALSFCDPVQPNPAIMPKGAWQVTREPFVSNPAAGPFPGNWHTLHAEVTFKAKDDGQPVTEVRRWCDGVEFTSTLHPGHPVQLVLVQLHRGKGEIKKLRASRLGSTVVL